MTQLRPDERGHPSIEGTEYLLLDGTEDGQAEQKVSKRDEHLHLLPINAEQPQVNNHKFFREQFTL